MISLLMKLTHFGISHFRSIGETPVMIDLSKKITVLVGQNDCGKSNVLRGIEIVSTFRGGEIAQRFEPTDFHEKRKDSHPRLQYHGAVETNEHAALLQAAKASLSAHIDVHLSNADWPELANVDKQLLDQLDEETLDSQIFGKSKDENLRLQILRLAHHWIQILSDQVVRFRMIPVVRHIDNGDDYSLDGKGLIKRLGSWLSPDRDKRHERAKYERIVHLLRAILERDTIGLDVTRGEAPEIIVTDMAKEHPLECVGTGIHQLIILAIAALSEDNAIFGIEEPEIHLHPVLQRRFLKFLREETGNNRYIITTHSQTMIAPAKDVDVIHLKMEDGVTIPTRITTDAHALEALEDLGIRASDLLQANSVIWVEGPSDRIYLKRWMELVNAELGGPELIEGIDYSIMFYGGRLLSHVSLERDGEADDGFVQLLRINQRSAILMDSDRRKGLSDPLNATKQRVIAECEANGLHAWVTDGREIENYLTQRSVEAAVTQAGIELHFRFGIKANGNFSEVFGNVVGPKAPSWCDYAANKVPWAHRLVKHIELQDVSPDLKKRVTGLIHFIRRRPLEILLNAQKHQPNG